MRYGWAPSLLIIADVGPDHAHVGDEAMLEANVEALRGPIIRSSSEHRC
jgi:hypothetical protein